MKKIIAMITIILILTIALISCVKQPTATQPPEKTESIPIVEMKSENNQSTSGTGNNPNSESLGANASDETDEFGNTVSRFSDTSRFPLYAMINSENIYLYGIENSINNNGMILYKDGQGKYFDWPDLAGPFGWMPELSCFDYNGDNEKELAVILYSDKGTECLMTDLHILKPKKDKWGDLYYEDHSLLSEDFAKWFTKKITAKYSKDKKTIIVNFNGKDYEVQSNDRIELGLKGVEYGKIVEFEFNEKKEIIVSIGIGFNLEKMATIDFFGDVEAKVNFDGTKFCLSDYKFTIN